MSSSENSISPTILSSNTPVLQPVADSIMHNMESLSPLQIADILGISRSLAIKAHELAYNFPHKQTGYKAILGFIGDAYRALDIKTLPETSLDEAEKRLRIISSVYGILKPLDIIKPYRCEFLKPIAPQDKTPCQVFKPKVTTEIVNHIKKEKTVDIINLLPADAEKCIDFKIIRAFSKVHKICFANLLPDGKLKTPIAKRLKELRGIMARTILKQGINSFSDLIKTESSHFIYSEADSKPGLAVFISD